MLSLYQSVFWRTWVLFAAVLTLVVNFLKKHWTQLPWRHYSARRAFREMPPLFFCQIIYTLRIPVLNFNPCGLQPLFHIHVWIHVWRLTTGRRSWLFCRERTRLEGKGSGVQLFSTTPISRCCSIIGRRRHLRVSASSSPIAFDWCLCFYQNLLRVPLWRSWQWHGGDGWAAHGLGAHWRRRVLEVVYETSATSVSEDTKKMLDAPSA